MLRLTQPARFWKELGRMLIRPDRLSLSRRIVMTVGLGLALILAVYGVLVLWTVHDATEDAYRERVTLARVLARRVDDVLRYSLWSLLGEASALTPEQDGFLSPDQLTWISEVHRQNLSLSSLFVSDANGRLTWTYSAQPGDGVSDQGSCQVVILQTLQTGHPQIDEIPSTINHAGSVLCMAVPLQSRDGRIVGALATEMDPRNPMLNLLPSGIVADSVQVELLNTVSQSVVSPAGAGRGTKEHLTLLRGLIDAQSPGYVMHEPSPGAQFSSHIVGYAPVSLLPSWGVLVEQPQDVVLTLPRQLQQRMVLFGLIALAVGVGVAWFDVRRVVRPLSSLTRVAERFAAGQLDEPVTSTRLDELGILSRAFETMRQRIRAYLAEEARWSQELETRVANRTAELEGRNRELAHLNAIASIVGSSLDIKSILDGTLEHVIDITGADVGRFSTLDGETGLLVVNSEFGPHRCNQAEPRCTNISMCREAVRSNRVVLSGSEGGLVGSGPCCPSGLLSAVAIPLLSGDRVQGALFLGSSQYNYFQSSDLSTLAAVGHQVGVGLAKVRLYQSLQAREREREELLQRVIDGQEDERRRLARELHDDTSQALASLQLGLERLANGVDTSLSAKSLATDLQLIARDTLGEVHRLAVELRPSVLDDVGLLPAIERLLEEWSQHWGPTVDFVPLGVDHFRLIPPTETAVYRIVQAALTNIAQHAEAKHVSVLMKRREESFLIVIEDDGRGFDLQGVRTGPLEGRLGLAGMEERASLIGATLTIETSPGSGTTMFLEVPVEPNRRKVGDNVEAAHYPG